MATITSSGTPTRFGHHAVRPWQRALAPSALLPAGVVAAAVVAAVLAVLLLGTLSRSAPPAPGGPLPAANVVAPSPAPGPLGS
jgi:hypothetical protein